MSKETETKFDITQAPVSSYSQIEVNDLQKQMDKKQEEFEKNNGSIPPELVALVTAIRSSRVDPDEEDEVDTSIYW